MAEGAGIGLVVFHSRLGSGPKPRQLNLTSIPGSFFNIYNRSDHGF
jgi:hypothetical protein